MVEFFHQRTAVQFLGQRHAGLHPSPGAANGGRSVTARPTMAACSETGSIACVRRWKPLAWAGWASPAARIWRIFQCHLLAALRAVCCPPPAAPRLAAATRRTGQHLVNGNALVARLLRSALDAGVRFQLNAPVVRLLGPPGVSNAVLRSDSGRFTSKLAPWCWPAAVFPRSPAAGAGGAPRGGGLRPFLRRTAGQSGRGIRLGESVGGQFDTSLRHPLARAPVSRVTLASGQQLMFPHLVERAKPG